VILIVLIVALVLLALFGMPLFAVFGALALFLFHAAEIDISSVAVSMYAIAGSRSSALTVDCA
jgi:hypothetical protein